MTDETTVEEVVGTDTPDVAPKAPEVDPKTPDVAPKAPEVDPKTTEEKVAE